MSGEALEDARRELAGTRPVDFAARRAALVSRARSDGDADLAAAIRAIRKPTQSAWTVNVLVQQRSDEVTPFVDLGRQLREQQLELAADELRELNARRVALVRALVGTARDLARERGVALSPTHAAEVEQTLAAAFSDDAAAAAVLAGTLTTALQYAGLGFAGAVTAHRPAAQKAARTTARSSRPAATPTGDEVAAAARRRAARTAAVGALDRAQQELERLTAQAQEAEHDLEAAQLRVATAERDLQHAKVEEQRAEQLVDSLAEAVETAQTAVSELHAHLGELEPD